MKPNQWVPAAVVLVVVGLLTGGASLLRTFADERPEPVIPSVGSLSVPPAGPRIVPQAPAEFDAPALSVFAPNEAVFLPADDAAVSEAP